MNPNRIKISLFFLLLVALVGTYLRSVSYFSLPLTYANLVHAHSHTAFQGWIYTLLFLLLVNGYLPEGTIRDGRYSLQFNLTAVIVLGVLISFSLQGYALYSISFSTVFQLLNYWFIFRFLRDVRKHEQPAETSLPLRFIKTGLYLGLLSTLLPFAIGATAAQGMSGSELYESLIYTFLHLQYNGWFLFVGLGLFFRLLDKSNIGYHRPHARNFYWLMTVSVLPAVALSLVGMSFSEQVMLPAYAAAILQAVALGYFMLSLKDALPAIFKRTNSSGYLMIFLSTFVLKVVIQNLAVLPVFEELAFHNRNIILFYLHLSLLGVLSFLLLALVTEEKWLGKNRLSKAGGLLFIFGFLLTEVVLAAQGLGLFFNQELLITGSASMVAGILVLLMSPVKPKLADGH